MKNKSKAEYIDILDLYMKEINKYPLLKVDEEVKYFKRLENPENKKLLAMKQILDEDDYREDGTIKQHIEKHYFYHLNTNILFKSLSRIKSYDKAINVLLDLYSSLNTSNEEDVKLLLKYKRIADSLGRSLNSKELLEYFNIPSDTEILDPSTLAKEIKEYMLFKHAYNKVYISNLRLVIPIVKSYYSTKLEFLDMINEGNIGLTRAIDGYDLSKGTKFSTYAYNWIDAKVGRAVRENKEVVRMPEYIQFQVKKYKQRVEELQKEKGRSMSLIELSKELNVPIDKLRLYLQVDTTFLSLNQQVGEDDNATLMDFIPDENNFNDIYKKQLMKDIEILYEYLKPREIEILKWKFGIGSYQGEKYTGREAGKMFNVSHSRADQILTTARFKLIRAAKRDEKVKALRDYLCR